MRMAMDRLFGSLRPGSGLGEYNVVRRYLEEAAALASQLCSSAERETLKSWLVHGDNLLAKSNHDEAGTFAVIASKLFPESAGVPAETLRADEDDLRLIHELQKHCRPLKSGGGGRPMTGRWSSGGHSSGVWGRRGLGPSRWVWYGQAGSGRASALSARDPWLRPRRRVRWFGPLWTPAQFGGQVSGVTPQQLHERLQEHDRRLRAQRRIRGRRCRGNCVECVTRPASPSHLFAGCAWTQVMKYQFVGHIEGGIRDRLSRCDQRVENLQGGGG